MRFIKYLQKYNIRVEKLLKTFILITRRVLS